MNRNKWSKWGAHACSLVFFILAFGIVGSSSSLHAVNAPNAITSMAVLYQYFFIVFVFSL